MKFTIEKEILRPILSDLVGLTTRKTNLAITENVLISAEASADGNGPRIVVSATDLETGFQGSYPAVVEEPGSIAIGGRRLHEIVRQWPHPEITIHEIENRWVEISGDKVEYHIVGMNPDDFPDVPAVDEVRFFEVPGAALANAMHRAGMVSAADDSRAHVAGVHLVHMAEENLLRFESTDSARLHFSDAVYTVAGALPEEPPVLIPKAGMAAAAKFVSRCESVRVGVAGGQFVLRATDQDDASIFIRLLEGEFPDTAGLMSQREKVFEAMTDREKFTAALKRMSIFATSGYPSVALDFDSDHLTFRATNPDVGEASEELDIAYPGQAIEATYNIKYLLDSVSAVGFGDSIRLEFISDSGPLFVSGTDKTFFGIVMPMRP